MRTTTVLSTVSLALAAWLAGCASSPSAPPTAEAPQAGAPAPSAPPVSLAAEQKRLADLFRGTPVVFEMTAEGNLRVEVPLKFSFDKGRAVVKPPLAAVLDRVATSAKSPGMRTRVAGPADASHGATLAQERAASARDYLVAKGVPIGHFAGVGPASGDNIEIVIGKL